MLNALSQFLHGGDFPVLGTVPRWATPVAGRIAGAINGLPLSWRRDVYTVFGALEAVQSDKLDQIHDDELAEWLASRYPNREYPAVMIGSSGGATVHLCAALGVPWLPQTYLIPVSMRGVSPDDPKKGLFQAMEPARKLLDANPNLQLHHMQDPVQDRLMLRLMTYFRVKRLSLGPAYEMFIRGNLRPGGTIFLMECEQRWPAVQVGEHHFFQFGAVGGASADEYYHGSARVKEYLREYGDRSLWDAPAPDAQAPEAEWGFEPALGEDVERFANENGYKVRRAVYEHPEDLSFLVADLYRWWYDQLETPVNRLLVETFIGLSPYWALRHRAVPLWLVFNTMQSASKLGSYLDSEQPVDRAEMILFSNGIQALGQASIGDWRKQLARAAQEHRFLGVDERKYPADFAAYQRHYVELVRDPIKYPIPPSITLDQFDAFLRNFGDKYPVTWEVIRSQDKDSYLRN